MRSFEMVACALALMAGGCAATGASTGAAAPLPADYRGLIAAKVKETFFDPYSIRDAAISQPIPGQSVYGPVTTVCVRANARNRMGGYTGVKPTSFTFRDGALTVTDSQYAAGTCASAIWEPFPEIASDEAAPQKRRP